MVVDIIIPAFNAQSTIDRTLASIVMQKLDEGDLLRTIIVDDCSNETYDTIAEYWGKKTPIAVVEREKNGGCGQSRQTGIDFSDADYIMFVDADDTLASPFAVRTLLREIVKEDLDMVMGEFVEETAHGYFNHGANFVWCHGKMYRRKFLVDNNIRFNETRCNEDVGFHSLFHQLTDKVQYIPQVVYMWENYKQSTVRAKADAYAYDYGWREFIENMTWAAEEMSKRGVSDIEIAEYLRIVIPRFYWQLQYADKLFPENNKKNWKCLHDFYGRVLKRLIDNGTMTMEIIEDGYRTVTADSDYDIIPKMTFDDYLKKLGVFKDIRGEKAQ